VKIAEKCILGPDGLADPVGSDLIFSNISPCSAVQSRFLATILRSRRRSSVLLWRAQMIGEDTDGPNKLDQTKEAVQAATQTVKETTQSVADAIEAGRYPSGPLERLAGWAQEAPLHAITVAFLLGVLLGRR
jgi:hypothetical protein